ncbi:uncharacterized protein SETTUDRAFT_152159 [Exserohilum turcica Et28A]|uniref:BTB domain-containing protein n=1 Tax=Exserohilum turcicum (strain 28A) TaxID=671987 RepID=R0K7S7_EXST2|nr:uncharacterized protein SETTUDRAFT_152159 [Exserohilum turcica Et28A]EOA85569.1 hypothetical protein SETTUDRAFT_152159 [Exserohilum turcica Et28A]
MLLFTHEIDPFADTIIILKNPCKNFAPWDETLVPAQIEVVGGVENPSVQLAEPASGPTQSEDDEIHYLVSSRHLMLASPWFRRTLTRKEFAESSKNPSDGRYHIQANDWDEKALLILLNIFHVRTRQVPAIVSLEMLAKIAVLVDYYELENAEAIERDTKNWIASVRRNVAIPSSYCRDLMLWICISRVFCMCKEFEKATAVAIKESKGWIQTLDLPIHQGITSSIDRIRCNALEHVISELHRLLRVYRDFNYSCPHNPSHSFQCGAFLFGALMKYMERWGCLLPQPENPFMGISLNEICNRSGMAENTKWWVKSDCYDYYRGYDHEKFEVHSCSLNAKIDEVVQDAMAKVRGLKLQDFRDNSQISFQN